LFSVCPVFLFLKSITIDSPNPAYRELFCSVLSSR